MDRLPPLVVPRASYVGALLALLVPGLGHWWIGRARRGLGLFVLGTLGLNAVLASLALGRGDEAPTAIALGAPTAIAAWLASAVDGVRLALWTRVGRVRAARAADLAEGTARLDAGDLRAARSAFARAAAPDACDAAALLGLARTELRSDEPARALAHAARALGAGAPEPLRAALRAEADAARARLGRG